MRMANLISMTRGRLVASQIDRYHLDGYVVVPDLLNSDEVMSARAALTELVEEYAALTIEQRTQTRMWLQFEPGFAPDGEVSDAGELELKVRKFMWFCERKSGLKSFVQPGHAVHDTVTQLIGENPIMFQDMALIKPPHIGSEKPWHQDNAYFSVAPLKSVCGVWIALDDATVANGCMHVLPGWHQRGGLRHYHGRDCEVAPGRIDAAMAVPVPVSAGSAMLFYGMLPHQTPPNASPYRRRALQFHFRAADSQVVSQEEYDEIYSEADGSPASCSAATRLGTV